MGEKSERGQKKSWFQGMKAEFDKIWWPDKNTIARQTTAVVVVSVLLGAVISVLDALLKYGIDLLIK